MSLARILPQIALVDGGVLGVDRNKLTGCANGISRSPPTTRDSLLASARRLFDVRAAWLASSRSAHDGHEHAVDIIAACELAHGPCANAELRALGQLLQHSVRTVGGVGHGNGRNRKLTGKRNKLSGTGINGKRHHLQTVGMLTANIERLGANRARTAPKIATPQTAIGGRTSSERPLQHASDHQKQLRGNAAKDKRVATIEHAAMARNKVARILDAHATLDA